MQRDVTNMKHCLIKVPLTVLLIAWVLYLGMNQQLFAGAMGPFFSPLLACFLVIHLRIRPKWMEGVWIVLITAFFAALDFRIFHRPPTGMAYLSFVGLSSFFIISARSVWDRNRRLLLYAWVPAAIYVMMSPLVATMHFWTFKAHPNTLDLYLMSFDSSLRVQLAFTVGYYYARLPWLHHSAWLAYVSVPIPMALVYAGRLVRFRERAFPCVLAFLLVGPLAFLFYNLFPACGPLYVFGRAFPFHPSAIPLVSRLGAEPAAFVGLRNAMPSVHLACVLLAWWYSRGLSSVERLVTAAYLVLNVLATLGTGEHWFVDLVVAFPYALMVEAICAYHIPWGDPVRRTALFLGSGGTLGWIAALRYGTDLFWTSPVVPWALSAATIALVLLRQARLDAAPNLDKHTPAASSTPASSPPANGPIS